MSHPEDSCDECGGPNFMWFAPSEIWNAATGNANILCPICFVKKAKAAGFNDAWRIAPETYDNARESDYELAAARRQRDEAREYAGRLLRLLRHLARPENMRDPYCPFCKEIVAELAKNPPNNGADAASTASGNGMVVADTIEPPRGASLMGGDSSARPSGATNDGPTLERAIAYCKGQAMHFPDCAADRAYDKGVAACVRMLEDMQPYPDEPLAGRSAVNLLCAHRADVGCGEDASEYWLGYQHAIDTLTVRAIEDAERTVALHGWQPMETAPKDRNILLWDGEEASEGGWISESDQTMEEECGAMRPYWWSVRGTADKATHWQSMPSGPCADEPHLWPTPLVCRYCSKPISGEGITEDAGETWAHLACWQAKTVPSSSVVLEPDDCAECIRTMRCKRTGSPVPCVK